MPEIGEKLYQYKIISAIGSGGMGKVFLAEDTKLGRRTALKFLSPSLASDREHIDRFLREAMASSALNHPNICTIYEINETADPPFIAMEYVEGETVAEMIRRRRRNIRETVEIAIQVAEALAEAHLHGIVHRDVKPANIIVNRRGSAKILDFGLAKRSASFDGDSKFQTNAGVVLGTASYMSPEQSRGVEVDARSDIWSLGVCIYEMLTGTLPFAGDSTADTFAAILTREPDPPSRHFADIPEELDHMVLHAIRKQRELRFQSIEELIQGLKAFDKKLNKTSKASDPHITNPVSDEPTEVFETAPTESNEIAGTDKDIPARKTGPNNLTAAYSPIIGREPELADLCRLILNSDTRLVTMTGIGGTGKTTLARAAARRLLTEFEHGVFFIEMADVSRPEVVAATIAQPLGIKEEGGSSVLELLKSYLSNRKMLLVIDNFEQVVEAAPQIAEILTAAKDVKVLVTSRELLRLTFEQEYQVPPLDLPQADGSQSFEDLRSNEALMLFSERAKAAKPTFTLTPENISDAAAICSRLEGLPLAIELAAARVKILSPGAVLTKLENRLNLLTGGSRDLPERQKTMRGAVMWSYDLLTHDEKTGFRALAVFSGGFRIESAEYVCAELKETDLLDVISSLIDKSLIIQKEFPDGESRFRMLEVVRDFALEALDAKGETATVRRRHAEFFVELGQTAEPLLQGAESEKWLGKLEEDHDNLRTAMNWSLANEPEMAIRLAVAVRNYWLVKSHLTEGFGWLKAASETGFEPPPDLRFKLLNGLGLAARFRGDFTTAKRAYEEGLTAGIEAGDKPGTALSNRGLGLVAMQQGDLASARIYFDAGLSISRDLSDKYGIAMSLSFLGDLARTEGRYADARPQFEEAVELFRLLENRTALSDAQNNLGAALACLGQTAEASRHFAEALDSAKSRSNRITISCSIDGLASIAAATGDIDRSARLSGAAEKIRELVGYKIEPAEAKFREHYLSEVKQGLSEEAFDSLIREGREMSLETAIEEALVVRVERPASVPS